MEITINKISNGYVIWSQENVGDENTVEFYCKTANQTKNKVARLLGIEKKIHRKKTDESIVLPVEAVTV